MNPSAKVGRVAMIRKVEIRGKIDTLALCCLPAPASGRAVRSQLWAG